MSEPVSSPTDRARTEEHADGRSQRRPCGKRAAIAVALGGALAVPFVAFAIDELGAGDRVPRGVHCAGIDIAHLDARRARLAIEARVRARLSRPLTLTVDGKTLTSSFHALGVGVDAGATVARAMAKDRDRGLALRFAGWVGSLFRAREVFLVPAPNGAALSRAVDRVEIDTLKLPFAGGLRLVNGRLEPEYPRPGRRLDREHVRAELEQALAEDRRGIAWSSVAASPPVERSSVDQGVDRARSLASASVVLVDPSSGRSLELSADDIARTLRLVTARDRPSELELAVDPRELEAALGPRRTALESDPKPARFVIDTRNRIEIEPSEPDARVEPELLADALLAAAASPNRRGVLPLVRKKEPELTTEGAKALGIRRLVSSFTTRHPCCERRVENIHRIADLLDGLVVKPGESVSVNAVVGPRTSKNGFVPAPSIEEGEVVDTVGGGVSQFATTLFNALFHGGYAILERQPHTYWFSRYPMGHEATLSYPKPDLVFKNDTEFGMLIDTEYTDKSITVRIFGENGGRKVEAQVSARQNVVDPPVEIQPNPELSPDRERTKEAGMVGWSVIVARVLTYPDGTKKEERRKVTYRPKTRRVEVHPCRVPKGEKGYTGERCPEPEDSGEAAALATE